MSQRPSSRRNFLKQSSLAALGGASLPYWWTSDSARAFGFFAANERPVIGCIGTGEQHKGAWRVL